jgi:hypothetical protein
MLDFSEREMGNLTLERITIFDIQGGKNVTGKLEEASGALDVSVGPARVRLFRSL